ncbi:outer membrane protein assembly factor BamB family protein [Streptomyces sp. NBC_01431]|uniref:outer membrane protein assembly factor BamB family protein n=1 Tax=Streptomyces sp. NBC_01431 TaxID=2903863 RepID=UPI002E377D74|nr:PQQ-binding-like beta-propeller repeat protein [Streptomyces sp. NBC_01431]
MFAVLVPGADTMVLRPLGDRRKRPARLLLFDLDGPVPGAEVGPFDVFNHPFTVRRASRPHALVGTDPAKSHRDKWVTALGADGTLRRLFPHSWVPEEHHFGGPAVELGQSLVCAGTVHDIYGLQPGGAYVIRRSLSGAVQWEYRTDHPATALDTDEDTVYVADNSGALVALDADDGSLRWRMDLAVDGTPTIALSLAAVARGHVLAGNRRRSSPGVLGRAVIRTLNRFPRWVSGAVESRS